VTTEPRKPRVRLWVVALAVVGGDLISHAIFAAGGVDYVATDLQIFAYAVVWVIGTYWLVLRASEVQFNVGSVLWVFFTLAALFAVVSAMGSELKSRRS
jgi:hypothetical protein